MAGRGVATCGCGVKRGAGASMGVWQLDMRPRLDAAARAALRMRDMWGSFAGETRNGFRQARRCETAGSRPTHNHARCQAPWQTVANEEKDPQALDRGSFSI